MRRLLASIISFIFEELEQRGIDLSEFGGLTIDEMVDKLLATRIHLPYLIDNSPHGDNARATYRIMYRD